ncbi:MAG: sulfatase [Cyclobacteriaceae bacterium]
MKPQLIIPLLISLSYLSCEQTTTSQKPNIVLINIDDMGWKDLGFMGSEYYETPNLDRLSKLGMTFSNGYASAANCAPSRASLMTGRWATRHGIYTVQSSERGKSKDRKLIPIKNTTTLSSKYKVFPEILNEIGYATCHSGKWHLSDTPLSFGFDINIGGGHNGHPSSYYPPYKNVSVTDGKSEYLTDLIMEKTLEFIDTVSTPFFLNYSPYAVHTPIQPVPGLLPKYESKPSSNGQINPKYASMIENLDRNIGLLISGLEKRNLLNTTLIIFTSDNGGLYGITKQHPLRAGKGSYYEGGIRVPYFLIWPGRIPANAQSETPITNLDIFPTILESVQVEYAKYSLDGASLWPILNQSRPEFNRKLYWHFPIYLQAYKPTDNENRDPLFRTRPGSVLRYGKWKLHYYFENNEMELYDLCDDIGERNNLVLEEPAKSAEMLKYLQDWWKKTNAPIPVDLNPDYEQQSEKIPINP